MGRIAIWTIFLVFAMTATLASADDPSPQTPAQAPASPQSAPPVEQPSASIADAVAEPVKVVSGSKTIVLGPQGVDDQGRVGRLHTVARGDTLWDLSAAYLGTAWVWPSVWTDNEEIANPHRIQPGDRIWITANEMRVVSDDEADAFLERLVEESSAPAAASEEFVEGEAEALPAAPAEEAPAEPTLASIPEPLPTGRQITVSTRAAMGFVTADQVEDAASILDSPSEKVYLHAGDPVYVGFGEGDTQVGDHFTIFEIVDEVRDHGSNRLLGHHVDVLGWLEIRELTGDSSIGEIRMSYSEIHRGARVFARPPVPRQVTVVRTPDATEGRIVFMPGSKTVMADGGYVYLNRGELDGLEVGSELEVVDYGSIKTDAARNMDVQTPDHKIATLVVVTADPQTAVAFVLNANRELEVGDTFRATAASLAAR